MDTSVKEDEATGRLLTPRQRERRERITVATFDLLARHGGEALSMRMIAEAAGVAERTLFNIYNSKDRLFASTVRERSEETIAHAYAVGSAGMGFFRELSVHLADKTFEAAELARALAPILIEHADLVGLPEVYERFAGSALSSMQEAGDLTAIDTVLVSRFICMRMVATVLLWAKGEIADIALESHLRLGICQILLPYAEGSLTVELREDARDLTAALSRYKSAP